MVLFPFSTAAAPTAVAQLHTKDMDNNCSSNINRFERKENNLFIDGGEDELYRGNFMNRINAICQNTNLTETHENKTECPHFSKNSTH